jgi:hypothetical protein
MVDNTKDNWKPVSPRHILVTLKHLRFTGKTMTTSTMTYSGKAASPMFGKKAKALQPVVSLRDWLDVYRGALAMASVLPSTGRVGAKEVERVRAMAELL